MKTQLELDQLKAELRQYPQEHQPESHYGERRQLVLELLDEIAFLRERKYSYKEISGLLHEKAELLIQPATLRRYFFEERAKLKGKSPRRKRSKGVARTSQKAHSTSQKAAQATPKPKSNSKPEPKPKSNSKPESEFWTDDWPDDDSRTSGLLDEPTFNIIPRG